MAAISELIDKSTTRNDPAFVTSSIVGTVIGRGGNVLYQHANGFGASESQPLRPDSVFWLASQSKLMGTIAALITVEKGLVGLDDDVSKVLPELASLDVLDGGEDANGVPTSQKRRNKISLRLLLSHQSGVGYDAMPASLVKWAKATGLQNTTLDSTQNSMKMCPLVFEPGTSWCYGAGIDWAGELVARLNKTTLEDFYQKNIWGPLGMTSSTFHPSKFNERIVQPCLRGEDGEVKPSPLPVPIEPPTETAGHGVWSCASDYAKLLGALLDGGGPVLSRKLVDEIFKPQLLSPESILPMVHGPYKPALGPSIPLDHKVDHGLAGLVNLHDFEGRRRAGTLQWSGMPNLIWWVDRETGIAATTFLQLMPVGDSKASQFNIEFEEAVYTTFGNNPV